MICVRLLDPTVWRRLLVVVTAVVASFLTIPAVAAGKSVQDEEMPPSAPAVVASPAAPAGPGLGPDDRLFTYQLSNIEGEKALEILKSLGYETSNVDSSVTKDGANEEFGGVEFPFATKTSRPVIFNLVDPMDSSFATEPKFATVATGAARERLLIVWNQDEPEAFRRLLDLLHKQIDVPAKQILVEVLVIELNSGQLEQLGVHFNGSQDGNSVSFLQDATTGGPLPFIYQFARPSVKTVLNLTATLDALVEEGTARVLSQPSVLLLDGRLARVAVMDQIPYARVLSSNLDVSNATVAGTSYVAAGIELKLRARASADDTAVTMRVFIDISSTATAPSVVGLVGPQVATRQVKTSVRVTNNTPFVIGGLIRSTQDSSKGGIPVLSKIPGLGRLFSRTSKNEATSEVIVVLTPHIIPPDDSSFTYTIPRDFDLFDYADLQLFRNVYRVKTSDIWDLGFIHESEFMRSLSRSVATRAEGIYECLAQENGWPPMASGDRVGLARQLRELEREDWQELANRVDPTAAGGKSGEERKDALRKVPYQAFVGMLDDRLPGEDKLVKRMLIGIIEGRDASSDLSRRVPDDKIIFFPKPKGFIVDPRTVILDPLPLFETIGKPEGEPDCRTDLLSFKLGEKTTQLLPFDPPTAGHEELPLQNARFNEVLRQHNQLDSSGHRWAESAILLNACYETRGRSLREHLRSVLVLKRLLDLNPTLPLTLEGFHVGRDIILPSTDDLENRHHLVDWEVARLFYETLDYYTAFQQSVEKVLAGLPPPPDPNEVPCAVAAQGAPNSTTPTGHEANGTESEVPLARPVDAIVRAWADAWSAQDTEGYLSFYAADFPPPNGRSLTEWRAWRTAMVEEPESIRVDLSDLEVSELDAQRTLVRFAQEYRSDAYHDVVRKALILTREGTEWKIHSETTERGTAAAQ